MKSSRALLLAICLLVCASAWVSTVSATLPLRHWLRSRHNAPRQLHAEKQDHAPLRDSPTPPLDTSQFQSKTVAFVSAHPDDIEASAGGLIYRLTQQGTNVHYIIFTNGDKGCVNAVCANMTNEQLAVTRMKEQADAGAVLGVPRENIHLLDFEDSMLTSYPEVQLRMRLVAVLRQVKPFAVFSWEPSPTFRELQPQQGFLDLGFHPDHMRSGVIALDAHLNSGLDRLWPELGPAWTVTQYYMFDWIHADVYVDITDVIETKAKAFNAHVSQVPLPSLVLPTLQHINAAVANRSGVAQEATYAEGFVEYF